MAKIIRLSDEMHAELMRIAGELQAKNGKAKTLDDAVRELVKAWKQTKKHP